MTSDNQHATGSKNFTEQGSADSTSSTPIPRKSNPGSITPNLMPKLQIDSDEDADLEEALRMSLEQSLVEQNRRMQEDEQINMAINASMSILDNGANEYSLTSDSVFELDTTNNESLVKADDLPTSDIVIQSTTNGKIRKNPGRKDVFNEIINLSDSNCDTSTVNDEGHVNHAENRNTKRPKSKRLCEDSSSDSSDGHISSTKSKRNKLSQSKQRASRKSKYSIQYESDDSSKYHTADDTTIEDSSINNKGDDSSIMVVEASESEIMQRRTRYTGGQKELYEEFKKVESLFRRVLKRRLPEDTIPSITSIEVIRSPPLETAYSRQKEAFEMQQIPTAEVYVYHKCEINAEDKLQIINNNLNVENTDGYRFGRGIYFTEYPDLRIGNSDSGLLLCKLMPGYENLDKSYRLIPENYNSKRVLASEGSEEILIVENSSQILPCYFIYLDRNSVRSSVTPNLPYTYKVKSPMDILVGPLEDESNIPHILTIHSENVPANTKAPDMCSEEQEPLCGSTSGNVPNPSRGPTTPVSQILNNEQIAKSMRNMFESSLKLQETGQLMMPAETITTQLFKHQMCALAWMTNRENSKETGVSGGILADDMGLGKTLTVLALIVSNFHDKRPIAKIDSTGTYSRKNNLSISVMRYMPNRQANLKLLPRSVKGRLPQIISQVGEKLYDGGAKRKGFNNLHDPPVSNRRKDNTQQVKSSKHFRPQNKNGCSSLPKSSASAFDLLPSPETSDDNGEKDEFDSMCFSTTSTLSERLFGSNEKTNISLLDKPERHFYDGLSDDEEYQNMTEAERNERLKPKFDKHMHIGKNQMNENLNLDGMPSEIMSSSEDEDFVSTTTHNRNKRRNIVSSDEDECDGDHKKKEYVTDNSISILGNELPDIEESFSKKHHEDSKILIGNQKQKIPLKSSKNRQNMSALDLTEEQRQKLIIPPRDPPKLQDRRRATLIVTPASLLGHWLMQIEQHIDDRVNLAIAVHHGQCKALLGTELQDNDIVFSTYGTLQAEYSSYQSGPLLRAKWLRVVLDEGHFIKNHNSKTAKACYELDTRRKWIISGTPIQNNLTELWALLKWLEVEPYASHRTLFKRHIEHAIKHGHPHGIQRLQTLMQAICMRRTKSDQINGKPIVDLPEKTVTTTELEFTEEETIIYKAWESEGREIIQKYQRRGALLSNYAHVFAIMMRLRQLCCHRELLPVQWNEVDMHEVEEQVRREMQANNTAKAILNGADNSENGDRSNQLAEQLRDMIKEGLSDECSICLSEFTQPVITPCAHIYCKYVIS